MEMKMIPMEKKMITRIEEVFTHDFLVDLLSGASYGSEWFIYDVHEDTPDEVYQAAKERYECREDIWAYVLTNGGCLSVNDWEEDKEYRVTLQDIINGLSIAMFNYPEQYANIMLENADFYDYDCVIQCAVFGDLVYG